MTTVGVATGAARGMGRACAERLAQTCDVVVLVDLDRAGITEAARELQGAAVKCIPLVADVSDREAVQLLADAVREAGELRAVAHAAGISPTMDDWRAMIKVDLVGTALIIQALTPLVVPGTALVCFASMAAQLVVPDGDPNVDAVLDDPLHPDLLERLAGAGCSAVDSPQNSYGWAKRGVQRLARRQAVVWGKDGGRICSVSPGMIATPMGQQEFDASPEMAFLLDLTPVQRMGRTEEVADLVAYLLSDAAGFLTGIDVLIDGGVVAAIEASGLR